MKITKSIKDNVWTINLEGRLDANASGDLEKELEGLEEQKDCDIVFDFEKLQYISSRGLRVLLKQQKSVNKNGTSLQVINASEAVKEVFEITGFSSIIDIQ